MREPLRRLQEAKDPDAPKTEPTTEAVNINSLDGRADMVRTAWRQTRSDDEVGVWPEEVHMKFLIVNDDGLKKVPYTIDKDQAIEFGEPEDVVADIKFRTVSESGEGDPGSAAALSNGAGDLARIGETGAGHILESLDDGAGFIWRVTMIQPGTSKNGRRYRPQVLKEAVALYEGARAFDGHRDPARRRSSPVSDLIGWHENVTANDVGSLESDFHISESAPHIRNLFLSAHRQGRPDLIGFSHDVSAYTKAVVDGGKMISDVTKIAEVHSVDSVADPSAGGRIERLVASDQPKRGESVMDPIAELLEALLQAENDEKRQELLEAADPEVRKGAEKLLGIKEAAPDPKPDPKPEPVTETVAEPAIRKGTLLHRTMVREALSESKLPKEHKDKLVARLAETDFADEDALVARVKETEDLWSDVLGAQPGQLGGQGARVEIVEESLDRYRVALDGLLSGKDEEGKDKTKINAFRSLKEAYSAFTGRQPYAYGDTEDFHRDILAESVGAFGSDRRRLSESIVSSTWSSALGDSITRRAIAEYSLPSRQTWRQIVSSVVPVADFRTQRRNRIGGYDVLPTVGEGGVYQALTSPTEEEATYAPAKKGGTEDLTLETIANDDIGAVRRIPSNLGIAAALTLYRAIWIDLIQSNAVTTYDATALFDAAHANTTAVALAEAAIGTLRNLMVTQSRLGESSGVIGAVPKYLVVPSELWVTGFKLTESNTAVVGAAESATTPNIARGLELIEVPELTDANDWFLVGDPAMVPTIEVGFYLGRKDPEILVQDAPAVGSVFTADKITYKVRHIWGLSILDHRGFQRGTQ